MDTGKMPENFKISFRDIEIANKKLIEALKRDKKLYKKLEKSGKLFDGYDPQMRKCHEENSELLHHYINQHGWPLPVEVWS